MVAEDKLRISALPPYHLGEIARAVNAARLAGREIIDLSQINPDFGAPQVAVDRAVQTLLLPHNHRYSSSQGISVLRDACARMYESRFDVKLDPEEEIVATMGIKEGIAHLLLALCNEGDHMLVPTPSYPVHQAAIFLAHAATLKVSFFESPDAGFAAHWILTENNNSFLAQLDEALSKTWPRPKGLIISFPNNPTGATVTRSFFEQLVHFARDRELVLIHDFAYADIAFTPDAAPSLLSIPGARDIAVEFYSLSKGYGMPGWRIGFCAGNKALVGALRRVKSYVDFGIFQPLQLAAVAAMKNAKEAREEICAEYATRMEVLTGGLREIGWEVSQPRGGVFVWARIPHAIRLQGSMKVSHQLLDAAGVAVSPGIGFDANADEFIRFALGEPEHRLRLAIERIAKVCE